MLDILNTAQQLKPTQIRSDGGTQPRAGIDRDTVVEYADAMRSGAQFPPITVFFDGQQYWLADGFHRYEAHHQAHGSSAPIYVDLRQGTQRDAILWSVGANADHGLRRTNEDKRRAVLRLLEDPEWSKWSNNEIAKRTKTTHPFVGKLRSSLETVTSDAPTERTYTTKHGTTATMNTANIGASQTTNAAGLPPLGLVKRATRGHQPASVPAADIDRIINGDEPRPADVADILRMINHVNETADVLTVDTDWIIDYLTTLAARWKLTVNPGDLHTILKQWRRDTLDQQEAERRQRRIDAAQAASTAPKPSTMAVHFSSDTPEHYTPQIVVDAVLKCLGNIDLDPCSNSHESPNIPANAHYTQDDNGLDQRWAGNVYMNPPYGREIGAWVQKLVTAHKTGNVPAAIALVPARTDTKWWATLRNYPVCFVSGRLKFGNADNGAPFPSAIFYLGADIERFYHAFNGLGDIWQRIEPGMFGE